MTLPLTFHGPAPTSATAVTIGVFDGVHLGHRHLLRQLGEISADGEQTLAIVLSAQPREVLGGKPSRWIDEPTERLAKLASLADCVAELRFDAATAALSACEMARLLFGQVRMRTLFVGYDSRFGRLQDDDFLLLPRLASELGFRMVRGSRFEAADGTVSSSRIRNALAEGDMALVEALLAAPYSLRGPVVHGRGVGHTLGFATANIALGASGKMLPPEGVYAVSVDGRAAVANLGPQPTFGVDRPTLEVHIPDFSGDLYGRELRVDFHSRLRPTRRFDSPEALSRQIEADIAQAQHLHQTTKP